MASGGFAGGLAEGINNAMQFGMRKQQYDRLDEDRDHRLALREEALAARAAKAEGGGGGGGKGGDYEGFEAALTPIFQTGAPNKAAAPPTAPMTAGAGLASASPATLPDAGLLAQNPAGAYQAGGLGAVTPQAAPPAQQEEQISPRQQIVKEMLAGNLSNEPDKLNAIHAAAVLHGLGDKVTPWMEHLYKAKKSGLFDAAMSLKRGDIDGGMAHLERGGIKLEDRPVKVDPNDNSKWKVNISGSGEQTIDLDTWATSTLDPEKYTKYLNDKQEAGTKGRVADAQIKNYEANAKESMAGAGLSGAKTKAVKSGGGVSDGSGTNKLPAPAATAEWLVKNKVYDNYKDAFNAVKTLNDKSPDSARSSLIEAAMKNGQSLSEAGKEVDDFLGADNSAQAPKTRKFNPKTGGFD